MELTRKRPTVPRLRGLPASRHGALALALVCAVAAAGVLLFALSQYRKSVVTAAKQDTVLVATGTIQKGTSGDVIAGQHLYRPTPILQKQLSAGAISDAAMVRGKVAVQDILPGQQLTLSDFALSSGVASQLAPNQRAVGVALDASHGLIGVVAPGDRVDVYGGFDVASSNGPTQPVTRLLIPNALVLKVPAGTAGGGFGSGNGQAGDVLLAVGDNQAPSLAYAADNGKVWLVLRPANAADASGAITSLSSILFGIQPKFAAASVDASSAAPAATTQTGTNSSSSAAPATLPAQSPMTSTTTTTNTSRSHK